MDSGADPVNFQGGGRKDSLIGSTDATCGDSQVHCRIYRVVDFGGGDR